VETRPDCVIDIGSIEKEIFFDERESEPGQLVRYAKEH
jgi:hypothetical protein